MGSHAPYFKGETMTKVEIQKAAAKYASAAKGYLQRSGIDEDGYGYIGTPTSPHIVEAIGASYHTAFVVVREGKADVSFVISRDCKSDTIEVDKTHMGLAIDNIKSTAGAMGRRIKFQPVQTAAEQEATEEKNLAYEIRKAMRKR